MLHVLACYMFFHVLTCYMFVRILTFYMILQVLTCYMFLHVLECYMFLYVTCSYIFLHVGLWMKNIPSLMSHQFLSDLFYSCQYLQILPPCSVLALDWHRWICRRINLQQMQKSVLMCISRFIYRSTVGRWHHRWYLSVVISFQNATLKKRCFSSSVQRTLLSLSFAMKMIMSRG